jgi:hypothetical protein
MMYTEMIEEKIGGVLGLEMAAQKAIELSSFSSIYIVFAQKVGVSSIPHPSLLNVQ